MECAGDVTKCVQFYLFKPFCSVLSHSRVLAIVYNLSVSNVHMYASEKCIWGVSGTGPF